MAQELSTVPHYLGVDIGTFETKGVLVDGDGEIVASAARQASGDGSHNSAGENAGCRRR